MPVKQLSVSGYIDSLPAERKQVLSKLREVIKKNIPKGFSDDISYGMPAFVVPHSRYPAGYHCKPDEPLPFISYASQKNFIALYHMGMYASPKLLDWFTKEYPKHSKSRLDMGKSCIRFKKPDDIPFDLIGQLVSRMTVDEWIDIYEKNLKK